MEPFFLIFLGIALTFWVSGIAVFCRLRRVPVIEAGAPKPGVKISVIIPARNEEDNLSRLLPSLQNQEFAPFEIIVVDDQSDDKTGEIAESHGATVIAGSKPLKGWLGKPWACRQGALAANGEWFLFLDADTILGPDGLINIGYLAKDDAVHSICPHHKVRTPYEQFSAFFNAIMILGMNAFTYQGSKAKEIGLFGQAMFISKMNYYVSGGHEAVKGEVLENFHLARILSEKDIQCRCYLGKGTIEMRMFPDGYPGLVDGWSKGFVSGANNTPKSALVLISLWLSGLIMITSSLTFLPLCSTSVAIGVGVLYLLGFLQCLYLFKHAGNFSVLTALLFPVPLVFYLWLFFRALLMKRRGEKVQWKGRDVG